MNVFRARPREEKKYHKRHSASRVFSLKVVWFVSSAVVFAVILETSLRLLEVPGYLLPLPSQVLKSLAAGLSEPLTSPRGLYLHSAYTFGEAITGFTIGSVVGVALGTLIAKIPLFRTILLPYIQALQAIPKVALAPILVVWFGFGMTSKIVTVVLLAFFPVLVNTMVGLANVDRDRLELLRSLRASRWERFRYIEFPNALPYVFAGLQVGLVLSIAGAIVSEFVGARRGLGVLLIERNVRLDVAGSFAVLIVLSLFTIAWSGLFQLLRRRIVFWSEDTDRERITNI